ncbi:hypothetical protein FRB99_002385, partial [Tulasnella sp. 403]
MASAIANPTVLWKAGATLISAGMISGSFGAHAIKHSVPEDKFAAWRSASHYA